MKTALMFAALGCLMMAGGCVTALRADEMGTYDDFWVFTTPAGATATASNGKSCSPTPCAIPDAPRADFTVTVVLAGYETETFRIDAGHDVIAGAAALAGGPWAIVDLASGVTIYRDPYNVTVTLTPLEEPHEAAPTP